MITLRVNQVTHELDIDPQTPLLWVLREHLGLTGSKFSCGISRCGACTVHLDGRAVTSCDLSVQQAADHEITTIEGIFTSTVGQVLQRAWVAEDVPQCGYCQTGQIMTAVELLQNNPVPSEEDINKAMKSVLCRCGAYLAIRRGILRASKELSA